MTHQRLPNGYNLKTARGQYTPEVSVVVPISERHDDMLRLYQLYANELSDMNLDFEFLFVVDGNFPNAYSDLRKLKNHGSRVKIIRFRRHFGESTALMEGFRQAKGRRILTLASYIQIDPKDLAKVFSAYDEGNELVITRRYPRKDPVINRIQSFIYHYFVRKLTSTSFRDITSGMRLISKEIIPEFCLYGDLHRFIPIFAVQKGIRVKEVRVSQREEDTAARFFRPGVYLRRLLDILTLFFLVKFTKKPLRFFGLIGTFLLVPGFLITAFLGILKLVENIGLANRPLLLLGILLMVFGIQTFSVGLIGELILFSHAKELDDYKIEEIID